MVEGIVCAYSGAIRSRRLSLFDVAREQSPDEAEAVGPNRQCRSCVYSIHKSSKLLLSSGCVSEDELKDACR